MLFLPEAFHFIGSAAGEGAAIAEPLDGPAMASYCALAARHRLWLSLGGFQEAPAGVSVGVGSRASSGGVGGAVEGGAPTPPPRAYNTHVVVSPAGAIVAAYRKVRD